MLRFMNLKLAKMTAKTIKTTFSKKGNPMKYPVQSCILVRTRNLFFRYFTSVSHETMKSILNVRKTSNLAD